VPSTGRRWQDRRVPGRWEALADAQAAPPTSTVLACAAVAAALVVLPAAWRVARHVLTVAHEGGHAVVAVLAGRRLAGIRLHSDTSGLTVSRGRPRGPGMVATLLAGYPAPAGLGLSCAAVLAAGRPLLLLWGVLALLAVLLLQIRNLFGLWVVLVGGAGLFAVTWWGGPAVHWAVAYTLTWFLLLGAPRAVAELAVVRRRGRARTSDADQLARLTGLPGVVWVGLLAVVTVGAAVLGTTWLLPGVLDPLLAVVIDPRLAGGR
jgi:hypothetical protein